MREIKKGEIWGVQRLKMYVRIVAVRPEGHEVSKVIYATHRGDRRKTYATSAGMFITMYKKVRYVKQ
jgi:hypothetical protein